MNKPNNINLNSYHNNHHHNHHHHQQHSAVVHNNHQQQNGSIVSPNGKIQSSAINIRPRKDSNKSNNSTNSSGGGSFLRNSKDCDNYSRCITMCGTKSSRRKNSIGSALGTACLNAMSSSPNSGCYYHYG